jgi:hypothetical protein
MPFTLTARVRHHVAAAQTVLRDVDERGTAALLTNPTGAKLVVTEKGALINQARLDELYANDVRDVEVGNFASITCIP